MIYEVIDKTIFGREEVLYSGDSLIEAGEKLSEFEEWYWGEDTEPNIEIITKL